MYQTHLSDPEALATLAVQARESSRCLLFDDDLRLSGRTNTSTGETWLSRHKNVELFHLAFSGIHVCSPRLLPLLPQQDVFSIMTAYVYISEKYILRAFRHDGGSVIDAGKPENMARAAALAALILSDKK